MVQLPNLASARGIYRLKRRSADPEQNTKSGARNQPEDDAAPGTSNAFSRCRTRIPSGAISTPITSNR